MVHTYKLNLIDDKICVVNSKIIFVDSDHRNYPTKDGIDFRCESQFIQFIDLILGSIHCCLHASATRKEKVELALIMKPLLERLVNNPKNKHSRDHYYKKQQIEFFPKRNIYELSEAMHIKQLDFNGNVAELRDLYSDNY